ncbi:MAG: apolipoprotein N-acyltransferase [Holosporales bacterium]|jgi:apolipoprotein N-acyltransferase|nr:apolipoprotein N-acyltransferase [Holosporales bacterium]
MYTKLKLHTRKIFVTEFDLFFKKCSTLPIFLVIRTLSLSIDIFRRVPAREPARKILLLFASLLGCVFGFCFTSYIAGFTVRLLLSALAFLGLLKCIHTSHRVKTALLCGLTFGTAYWVVAFFDLYPAFSLTCQEYLFPVCLLLLSLGLGLFIAIPCLFAGLIRSKTLRLVSLSLLIAVFEFFRAELFPQLPLNVIPSLFCLDDSTIGLRIAQFVNLTNIYTLTFVWLLILTCLFLRTVYTTSFATCAALFLLWNGGRAFNEFDVERPSGFSEIDVALIQPNIQQSRKLKASQRTPIFLEVLATLADAQKQYKVWREKEDNSAPEAEQSGGNSPIAKVSDRDRPNGSEKTNYLDFVVLPETVVPGLIYADSEEVRQIQNCIQGENTIVIFGADRIKQTKPTIEWSNSMFILSKDGIIDVYDKTRLLPFGEYAPLRGLLRAIFRYSASKVDCSAGVERNVSAGGICFVPRICSESFFKCANKDGKAKLIIQILNDGWFASSIKEQHYAIDRLRVIEARLPMIRVSNDGCTSVFDKFGHAVIRVPERLQINKFVRIRIEKTAA